MVTAVYQGDGASLLAEIHLAVIAHDIEIAIDKQCPCAKCTPERFLSVEVELTMAIGRCTIQSIVCTLEVAVFIVGMACTVQGIQVEATDETYPSGRQGVSMDIAYGAWVIASARFGRFNRGFRG